MPKLYEIADRYALITELLDDPEKAEMVFDTLDSMEGELQDKLTSIGKLIRNFNADEEALKEESKRLKERADAAKKQAEKLENYVKFIMQKNGFKKLDTPLFKFSLKSSVSLVVTDLDQVPEHFLKPQPPKPDIAGLKKHLKQAYDEKGLEMPEELPELGVKFETKENLNIK
jgi:regulator of replication initiation timing